MTGPYTLAVDCGGSGLKCLVLDADGEPVTGRVRVPTPYPLPPSLFVSTLLELASAVDHRYDRVSVGLPGLVRGGVVYATPHYVTQDGPFTPRRDDLVQAWSRLDVQRLLGEAFAAPTRVLNDAEIAGLAVIEGRGYEVMLTFGTGMGFAHFDDGRLLPKLEMSHAPFRKGQTYDQHLGEHERRRLGKQRWTKRVERAVRALQPALWWDRLYLGGGGAKHLTGPVGGAQVQVVTNTVGLLGGVRLWDGRFSVGGR